MSNKIHFIGKAIRKYCPTFCKKIDFLADIQDRAYAQKIKHCYMGNTKTKCEDGTYIKTSVFVARRYNELITEFNENKFWWMGAMAQMNENKKTNADY